MPYSEEKHIANVKIIKEKNREKVRKQILSILPRSFLEEVIDSTKRPHVWTRKELERQALEEWVNLALKAFDYLDTAFEKE